MGCAGLAVSRSLIEQQARPTATAAKGADAAASAADSNADMIPEATAGPTAKTSNVKRHRKADVKTCNMETHTEYVAVILN